MTLLSLLTMAVCFPAYSQVGVDDGFPAAQTRAAQFKRAAQQASDAAARFEFKAWGLDPNLLFLTRGNKPCVEMECAAMRRQLADALTAAPSFLRAGDMQTIFWDDPGIDSVMEGRSTPQWVSVTASPMILERVLVHELAHHYDDTHGAITGAFLDIRFSKQPLWGELDALWSHIRANVSAGRPKVDDHVRAELVRLRVPRRDDDDIHLTADGTEYWAGSVELYWLHRGDPEALRPYLGDREISYLKGVFAERERSRRGL